MTPFIETSEDVWTGSCGSVQHVYIMPYITLNGTKTFLVKIDVFPGKSATLKSFDTLADARIFAEKVVALLNDF